MSYAFQAPPKAALPPTEKVELFKRDGASSYGHLGKLVVVVGRGSPGESEAQNYHEAVSSLAKKYPQGIGIITLVGRDATPRSEAREPLLSSIKDNWQAVQGALFVVDGEGFAAAIQRSFMNTFILVVRSRDRIRIHRDYAEGDSWLLNRLDLLARRKQIHDAVMQFKQEESRA